MARKRNPRKSHNRRRSRDAATDSSLRIIGGRFRGRTIVYTGDPRTRPMKERVREALFNLVGPAAKGTHAIDLFAGTGALGLEALSRGAARATFIERHFPTARIIERNIAALGVSDLSEVYAGDAFLWRRRRQDWSELGELPWLVLCSPPYDFYIQRIDDMLDLLRDLHERAPCGSLFAVEADERFDFELLADLGTWDVRAYPPAMIGIGTVGSS
jgi:16S rRNA (guanine966-N2)-methyltransferase